MVEYESQSFRTGKSNAFIQMILQNINSLCSVYSRSSDVDDECTVEEEEEEDSLTSCSNKLKDGRESLERISSTKQKRKESSI
jgi:hypothetical protein